MDWNCKRCEDKGYVEYPTMINNRIGSTIGQCCSITKYSNEVQRRLNANPRESDEEKAKRELGYGNGTVLQMEGFRK